MAEIVAGAVAGLLIGFLLFWVLPMHATRQRWLHRHRWTGWTEYVELGNYSERMWERQRRCRMCHKTQRETVGRHYCSAALAMGKGGPCPHQEQYIALFEGSPEWMDHLEKDLGIWRER